MEKNNLAHSDPAEETAVKQTPAHRKRNLLIGGGIAAALVIGGAIGIPAAVHASQLSHYQDVAAQVTSIQTEIGEANANLSSQVALTEAQRSEALSLAASISELGKTDKSILPAKQTQALTDTGKQLTKSVKTDVEKHRTELSDQLKDAVAELRQADDKAAKKAKKGQTPEKTAPTSYLTLDVQQARDIAGFEAVSGTYTATDDGDINQEIVEDAEATLKTSQAELGDIEGALKDESAASSDILEAIAATLPALTGAAETAPAQAKAVVKAASQADAQATQKVTDTAKSAAKSKDSAAVVKSALVKYVDAALAAQKAHTQAVKAEAAAAAADAAAGNGDLGNVGWSGDGSGDSYNDPSNNTDGMTGTGGNPDPTPPPTYTPPTPTPTPTPTPPPTTTPTPTPTPTPYVTSCPPGTYPSGSWDSTNGIHCINDGEGGW